MFNPQTQPRQHKNEEYQPKEDKRFCASCEKKMRLVNFKYGDLGFHANTKAIYECECGETLVITEKWHRYNLPMRRNNNAKPNTAGTKNQMPKVSNEQPKRTSDIAGSSDSLQKVQDINVRVPEPATASSTSDGANSK
jgi:hypothetical protein